MTIVKPLRLIVAGTPDFAIPSLQALIDSEHDIVAVYTQPDRPAGRGQHLSASPVKKLALAHLIPVEQPKRLRDPTTIDQLRNYEADAMIVAAYGLLLPKDILSIPRLGCINIHASLLPRWRGAAPIQRAILEGDHETGITIMQMVETLDAGPILARQACPIYANDTAKTLHDRLAELSGKTLLMTLAQITQGQCIPIPQKEQEATYASKLSKEEARINWHRDAEAITRAVRAYQPWPIAFTDINEQRIRVWQAEPIASSCSAPVGTIIKTDKQGIDVATSKGIVRITLLQLPGKKPMSVSDILNSKAKLFALGNQLK